MNKVVFSVCLTRDECAKLEALNPTVKKGKAASRLLREWLAAQALKPEVVVSAPPASE